MKKTEMPLKIIHGLAWIILVGLVIKIGAIVISYIASIANNESAKNIFNGVDLLAYRNYSFSHFSLIVIYRTTLYVVEAYLTFLVIKMLKNLNFKKPFNKGMEMLMKKISFAIYGLWALVIFHNLHVQYLGYKCGLPIINLFSNDYVFIAGIVFVFTQIVKRGIEVQAENDLTI